MKPTRTTIEPRLKNNNSSCDDACHHEPEYIIPFSSCIMLFMNSMRSLPPDYVEVGTLDLGKNKRALILINLLGLFLMLVFGGLFTYLLVLMRPVFLYQSPLSNPFGLKSVILVIFVLLLLLAVMLAVMLLVHEAIHGFFFWLFSKTRPKFAFKGWYACAGLPGWYIPRGKYLITALSSFAVITLMGFLLLAFLPAKWLFITLVMMIANASGSVGDLVVVAWLLFQPRGSLAQDRGDSVTLYRPLSQI